MNNKGFAVTGIFYSILVIFLVFIVLMLFNLQNRKTILDELKLDSVEAVEEDNNYEYLLNEINNLKNSQIDIDEIYPIGSIYISAESTSPSETLGGTWVQLENRFLLGAGTEYTAGLTGGEATHTLTIAEIPSHNHVGLYWFGSSSIGLNSGSGTTFNLSYGSGGYENGFTTGFSGGGTAHNNMPPYLVVYMWKRTA